jgi:hypothetical protein
VNRAWDLDNIVTRRATPFVPVRSPSVSST